MPCLARFWMAVGLVAALAPACGDDGAKPRDAGHIDGIDGGAPENACTGPSDPRLVVAPQRLVHLTKIEFVNTVGALLGDDAAVSILVDPSYSEINNQTLWRIPFLESLGETQTITGDSDSFPMLNGMAQTAAEYVLDNFEKVTGCAPATDACATDFLTALAGRAFRRRLTADETRRLTAVYEGSKDQIVNGWRVTATIEQATSNGVSAILAAPQTLWRREIGDATAPAGPTPGIPLTDDELATSLAYFLTGGPPDAELLAASTAGTLRANLDAQTVRLLATPAAQKWLSTVMLVAYGLNRIYETRVDSSLFPEIAGPMLKDMHDEAKLFLEDVLWNGKLEDLLLSRTTFVNSSLASEIYGIPVPSGATPTAFVRATLPASERSGLLTNAAFITSQAGSDRESLIYRSVFINRTFLCLATESFPEELRELVNTAKSQFPVQTAQEQAAYRRGVAACYRCHRTFDAYGLALDGYDNIGRYRTTVTLADGRVAPVDAHSTLPTVVFGDRENKDAISLAQALAGSDLFPACVARDVLQHAMAELTAYVDAPSPPGAMAEEMGEPSPAGCAVRDVMERYASARGQSFADVVRAIVASPAFQLRTPDPAGTAAPADAGEPTDTTDASPDGDVPDAGVPDGGAGGAPPAPDVLTTLVLRQAVLGFALEEIARMRATVPPSGQGRLDLHTQAIESATSTIVNSIRNVGPPPAN